MGSSLVLLPKQSLHVGSYMDWDRDKQHLEIISCLLLHTLSIRPISPLSALSVTLLLLHLLSRP